MLSELKILFENIKNFRHLLTEGVSDNDIVDAIEKHEYLYIYYSGDDTIEKGYRTIRPYVLGTSKAGNLVVRAWQDKGKSDSLRPDSPRKRANHEYFRDNDGKEKAGWRLFIVDNITSSYPTGKRFIDSEGNVMIPPLYNPNDKQMTNIVAAVQPATAKTQIKGVDSIEEPDVVKNQGVKKSQFDTQTNKFKQFYNVGKNRREATARDIQGLYDVARRVMKKSPDKYIVAIDNKGDFRLVDISQKDKIPADAIVGKLTNLYDKLVRTSKTPDPKEQDFIKKQRDSVLKNKSTTDNTQNQNNNISEENTKNPNERKTFFKQ